jgi:hypothetical protein|tara:strand:- start:4258 stop:4671 length:414 start_codon:yes stop_codon:yes gene_type:complete
VHKECLHDARQYSRKCTICRRKFFDDVDDVSDSGSDSDLDSDVYSEMKHFKLCMLCLCVWSPVVYVVTGLLGQMTVGFFGYPFGYEAEVFKVNNWNEFFDAIVSFNFFISVVFVNVPLILKSISMARKLRQVDGVVL